MQSAKALACHSVTLCPRNVRDELTRSGLDLSVTAIAQMWDQ
jgi:hypothetical protein